MANDYTDSKLQFTRQSTQTQQTTHKFKTKKKANEGL